MNLFLIGKSFLQGSAWVLLSLALLGYLALWILGVFFSDPILFPHPPADHSDWARGKYGAALQDFSKLVLQTQMKISLGAGHLP